MQRAPRGGLLFLLVVAALCSNPQRGRARGPVVLRDYATVGRVVARLVDGRTVVVVPVAGTLRPRLSEPIRAGRRWRLNLTIEDAKLSIRSATRRAEGLESLNVEEVGADVRITVEVDKLGDYGARRSEEGMLLWIDAERRAPIVPAGAADQPLTNATTIAAATRAQAQPAQPARNRGSGGLIMLAVLAGSAGAAVRYVRRNGVPSWARKVAVRATPVVKAKLFGAEPENSQSGDPDSGDTGARVPLRNTSTDPRGRSAEIGDAFRVEPERPASGIAALAATKENDAH